MGCKPFMSIAGQIQISLLGLIYEFDFKGLSQYVEYLLFLQKERCQYCVAQCTVTKHDRLIMINVNCVDAHQVSMGCISNSHAVCSL